MGAGQACVHGGWEEGSKAAGRGAFQKFAKMEEEQ